MTAKTRLKVPRSLKRHYPHIEYVVDSTKPVDISVSKKDCSDAKRLDPTECALAKAAKRELRVDAVVIGMSTSYLIKDNKAIRFKTPQSVAREIISFDRHQDFEPGEYYLATMAPTARLGKQPHYYKNKNGGKNKDAKRKHHNSARVRVLEKGSE